MNLFFPNFGGFIKFFTKEINFYERKLFIFVTFFVYLFVLNRGS